MIKKNTKLLWICGFSWQLIIPTKFSPAFKIVIVLLNLKNSSFQQIQIHHHFHYKSYASTPYQLWLHFNSVILRSNRLSPRCIQVCTARSILLQIIDSLHCYGKTFLFVHTKIFWCKDARTSRLDWFCHDLIATLQFILSNFSTAIWPHRH
jgi:hypothetical protein